MKNVTIKFANGETLAFTGSVVEDNTDIVVSQTLPDGTVEAETPAEETAPVNEAAPEETPAVAPEGAVGTAPAEDLQAA